MRMRFSGISLAVCVILTAAAAGGCSTAPRLPQQNTTLKNQATDQRQLAETALQRNQLEQAEIFYRNSLQVSQRVDHGRGIADGLLGLGRVELHQGNPLRAAAYGTAAESVARFRSLPELQLLAAILQAEAAIAAGRSGDALGLLTEAESRAEEALNANSGEFVLLLHARGTALRQNGDYAEAEDLLTEARDRAEKLQDVSAAAASAYQLASVYVQKNALPQALDTIQYALKLDKQMENPAAIGSSLEAGAAILNRLGRSDEAIRYLQRAYGVYHGIGDSSSLQRVIEMLSASGVETGNNESNVLTIWEREFSDN